MFFEVDGFLMHGPQRRYVQAKDPKLAEKWEDETPTGDRLPRKTRDKQLRRKPRRTRNEE